MGPHREEVQKSEGDAHGVWQNVPIRVKKKLTYPFRNGTEFCFLNAQLAPADSV
jgi:hypothetical protein